VYFEEIGSFKKTPIYERSTLGLGAEINGPAIIVQLDSTTILHPGSQATVTNGGNIVLEVLS
jgi:N-methylhydantoinase A